MRPFLHRLALLISTVLVVGCTTQKASQNVYEGIQSHKQGMETPAEKAVTPAPPNYEDYEAERKRLRGSAEN
jgi:hypothetical protein